MKHKINTSRLTMSMMTLDDIDLFVDLDSDPEVMKYITGGKTTSYEDAKALFIPRLAKYLDPEKGWGLWKIIVNDSQTFAGWILIRPLDFFTDNPKMDQLEVGWRLKQLTWGKGIATEAAQAVVDYCVSLDDNIKAVGAIAVPENKASINVMQKLGMEFVSQGPDNEMPDIKVVYYSKTI
ncbi:GNAT family N-acetyltransferase [Shewanella sp. WXL01]|uniref:GNAT family N-acetyltransferase n=1 Tax=Shewanella sp. WXL01 TaxID=2709721 RepID=UPI0014384CD4|nr:GNAT family N-acetyltransferase [Shewanella sp. WXL01]NKF50686.1 GNAT family N-acetyltransferase [Shewanella sp. WXL01]